VGQTEVGAMAGELQGLRLKVQAAEEMAAREADACRWAA
jgi:hypothetical protein